MSGHVMHRVVGAGAAGVAAALAVAPLASADPTGSAAPPSPSASAPHRPATPVGKHVAPKPAASTPVVTPDFGFQKIRVGVQIRPGAFVPAGTTTGGSKVDIVETGPNAGIAAEINGTSCTTVPGSEAAGSTETFCEFFTTSTDRARALITRAHLAVPADAPPLNHDYLAFPGDTVTLTQSTVNANLVIDPNSQTVGPCVVAQVITATAAKPGLTALPPCPTDNTAQIVTFTDNGLPPTARDDTAKVLSGKTVDIDVLDNDTTHGAPVSIDEVTAPHHGTATPIPGSASAAGARRAAVTPHASPAGTPFIAYKSDPGFVGSDTFTYTITTANGSSTARVRVTVVAPPPTAVDDSASTMSGQPVTIDVLHNDNAHGGGALHVASVGTPGHGTATISAGRIVYTPNADFVGTDTFTYTAATAFGSATATVTVTVSGQGTLSNTGSSDDRLAGVALLLMVGGGAATVVGRRRYRAKHA